MDKEKLKEDIKEGLKKAVKVASVVAITTCAIGATCLLVKGIGSLGKGGLACAMSKANLDHHANQLNPNNGAFRARMNNHANQLNPNNWRYQGK